MPRNRTARAAGFTLVEVVVALAIAAMSLAALSRAFEGAWRAAHTPMDIVSAVAVARAVAHAGGNAPMLRRAKDAGFSLERRVGRLPIERRVARIAPAPGGTQDEAVGKTDRHLDVQLVSVRVTAPSGRVVTLERVELQVSTR